MQLKLLPKPLPKKNDRSCLWSIAVGHLTSRDMTMTFAELQTFILSTGKDKCPNCFGILEAFLYIQAIKCLDGSIWNFLWAHAITSPLSGHLTWAATTLTSPDSYTHELAACSSFSPVHLQSCRSIFNYRNKWTSMPWLKPPDAWPGMFRHSHSSLA